MMPNRKKSGVMYLNWKQTTADVKEKEMYGYPLVREYKYLGGWMNDKLKVAGHLTHVEKKIAYVAHKLSPIRMLKDLRLNINLFRTMCMPLYRMGLLNSLYTNKTDQNRYYKAVRKRFKAFCYLPRCLPNKIIKMLLGNIEDVAGDMAVRGIKHMEEDGVPVQTTEVSLGLGYYKDVPTTLYPVFDLMYRSACTEHNRLLNREELNRHGVEFNLEEVLAEYQWKRRKHGVNRRLKLLVTALESIGKRFTSRATLAKSLEQ